MLLFWKIRYLDRSDKDFKDRCLYLHTSSLDPVTRAAVEFVVENKSSRTEREILKYRHLFAEGSLERPPGGPNGWDQRKSVFLVDYFEDETGKELTMQEMGPVLTGDPNTKFFPRGYRPHDIALTMAKPEPIPLAGVSLTPDEVRLLGYFVRDLQELAKSALIDNGPGTLHMGGDFAITPTCRPRLETAVDDDEIRSFVTVFRRLCMENEPANFEKAVAVFKGAMGGHPWGSWVESEAKQYEDQLAAPPDDRPMIPPGTCTFTTKRLIDVFLYTRYAHQPDERRERQFNACLTEVFGKRDILTYMFLTAIWGCSLKVLNAGNLIAEWFRVYCDYHKVSPQVVSSLRDDHAGLGAVEKQKDRQERLFREQAEKLSATLWEQAGRPEGGPPQFLAVAREQLEQRLKS
jgi:hypothetical protein